MNIDIFALWSGRKNRSKPKEKRPLGIEKTGTSLAMLERHYDHINTLKAVSQLRDEESRALIGAGGEVDKRYEYKELKKSRAPRAGETQ